MALIKTDSSQKKTVVALVGVLVVAIGVTAMRLKPQGNAPAAAASQQARSASSPSGSPPRTPTAALIDRARNPFEKPAGAVAAPAVDEQEAVAGIDERPLPDKPGANPWASGARATIDEILPPMGVRPMSARSDRPRPFLLPSYDGGMRRGYPDKPVPESAPRPVFTLLATVNGEKGCSAVIRTGESEVKVVELGDLLEGGFRVVVLDTGRAVLTDGRETIVAKRPRT